MFLADWGMLGLAIAAFAVWYIGMWVYIIVGGLATRLAVAMGWYTFPHNRVPPKPLPQYANGESVFSAQDIQFMLGEKPRR